MRCAKHPQVVTYVQCTECDAPICPDCMVTGPVGLRCPNCARGKKASPLFQPKPVGLLRAGRMGMATAVGLGGGMKLLLFVGAAGVGYRIGEVVIRAGGRKRGRMMEWIAGGCAALAALLWTVPWLQILSTGLIGLI